MKTFFVVMLLSLSLLPNFADPAISNAAGLHDGLSARLTLYVAESLSLESAAIDISALKPANGGRQLFPGKVIHIRPAKPGKLLGRVLFAVTMQGPRGKSFVQWVLADIAWLQEVVVASHSLKRHHVIERGDLNLQNIRVKNRATPYATEPEPLIGLRMTQSLRTGQAIRTDRVEKTPVILRGDRILLSFHIGGLSILTTGKAKEDGLQGDLIKVMNLDSRKTVIATVTGPGRVRVTSILGE